MANVSHRGGEPLVPPEEPVGEVISVTDPAFGYDPDSPPSNWRTIVDAAMAYLDDQGGGVLQFPASGTPYDINNTGLGAIPWTYNGIWWVGDSTASIVRNTSTDGTALLMFGSTGSVTRNGLRNLKLDSISTAGHIVSFNGQGMSHSTWENLWLVQRATGYSIIQGLFEDFPGGCFENDFVDCVWEHGEGSNPPDAAPTVPAIDIESNTNLFSFNRWIRGRFHCHGGLAPFVRLHCTNDDTGNNAKWFHQNEFRDLNVEVPRRGVFDFRGCSGTIIRNVGYFDVGQNGYDPGLDGHLVSLTTGDGGRNCEYSRIELTSRVGAVVTLADVAGTAASVSSITRSGNIATLTRTSHGFVAGDRVYVAGADQDDYNGRFTVLTAPTADTLTFQVSNSPASPATGTITVAEAALDVYLGPDNVGDHLIDTQARNVTGVAEVNANSTNARIDTRDPAKLLVLHGANTLGQDGDPGMLEGIPLVWVSATTVRLEPGICLADNGQDRITITGNRLVDITVSGEGGLDTGVVAVDTCYDIYAIASTTLDLDANNPSAIMVLTGNDPVMPAGYDLKRRMGAVATFDVGAGVANVIRFRQTGVGRTRRINFNAPEAQLEALADTSPAASLTNVPLADWLPSRGKPILVDLLAGYVGTVAGDRMQVVTGVTTSPASAEADWTHLVCQVAGIEVRARVTTHTANGRTVRYAAQNVTDDSYLYVLAYEDDL